AAPGEKADPAGFGRCFAGLPGQLQRRSIERLADARSVKPVPGRAKRQQPRSWPEIQARSLLAPSARLHFGDAAPQRGDELLAVRKMRLLGVENPREGPLFQRREVDALAAQVASDGVADNIHQPFQCVQAAEQIIVLAIGARKEPGEMAEADALEALRTFKAFERGDVLRADPIDKDLMQLA